MWGQGDAKGDRATGHQGTGAKSHQPNGVPRNLETSVAVGRHGVDHGPGTVRRGAHRTLVGADASQ